jgi:UDP-glucose 4-epimerase
VRLLIIGSKGFIGSHCTKYFSKLKNYSVAQADIHPRGDSGNYTELEKENTDFDILFKNNSFDVCINASGSPGVGFSIENTSRDFILNTVNVFKILTAIKNFNPACRFINLSSAAVYGNPISLPVRESDLASPLSPYGFHKLQSEPTLREFYEWNHVGTLSLRIFSAYRPGIKKQIFWDIYQKIKNSHVVEFFGTGTESRDFIYIDDLVTAIDILIQKASFKGQVINVARGTETTISHVASCFINKYDPHKTFRFTGKKREGDPGNWKADISSLISLGFSPRTTIEAGVDSYIKWVKTL